MPQKALTATLLGHVRWVFECFSPCTKINISHFAVKHSSFPILAHGEVKGRSVEMSDSLDFRHIHFVSQQLTFSLLFDYWLSQNVMTRPPIWNQTICDKKMWSPQCVHTPEGNLSTNSTHFPKHKRKNIYITSTCAVTPIV